MSCEKCLSYEVCQFKPVDRPHECKYYKDSTEFISNKNMFANICSYIHEYFVRTPNGKIVNFNEHTHCPTNEYSTDDDFLKHWEMLGRGFGLHILHHDLRPISKMITDFQPYQMKKASFERYLSKAGYSDV